MRKLSVLVVVALGLLAGSAHGQQVVLQNATATFSQGGFPVSGTIDGSTTSGAWAIFNGNTGQAIAQTAVWETQTNVGGANTLVTFTLFHNMAGGAIAPDHNLGRFRLSFTTDDRSTFADGLDNGGDVTATWTVLDPLTFSSTTGESFTKLGDLSLLVSGGTNNFSTYTITANLIVSGVTGFRLEAMEDASLPFSGPGRQATNGNFTLSEFVVAVSVPEPSVIVSCGFGLTALAFTAIYHRRRRRRRTGAV
jgi:hypothetical protein